MQGARAAAAAASRAGNSGGASGAAARSQVVPIQEKQEEEVPQEDPKVLALRVSDGLSVDYWSYRVTAIYS